MIDLHIPGENAFVVFVGLAVGYVVYQRSATNHDGTASKADLALAIFVAAAVVGILGFLFGLGDGSDSTPPASPSSPAPVATPDGAALTASPSDRNGPESG